MRKIESRMNRIMKKYTIILHLTMKKELSKIKKVRSIVGQLNDDELTQLVIIMSPPPECAY